MTQYWSWRVYVFILALAITCAVFVVYSPLVWVGVAGILVLTAQFVNPISSLAVVVITCALLSYSPFEAGALSRLFPGDLAIGIFIFAWLARCQSWSFRDLFQPDVINRPLLGIAVVTPVSMLWSRLHPDPSVTSSFPHSDVAWTTTQVSQILLLLTTICMPFAVAATIKTAKQIETVVLIIAS